MDNQKYVRNFAIIAHIDHGKSTLADRLLEMTGTVAHRDMSEQLLDSNPIERERGITIKLAPVRMMYRIKNQKSGIKEKNQSKDKSITHDSSFLIQGDDAKDGDKYLDSSQNYILNLIDTPGHVDFSYEVSRSLAACEGAVLVVDATQGVQAQTLAHLYQARQHNLSIIPVLNKIDIPTAQIEEVTKSIVNLGFDKGEIIKISAKTGENVDTVLEAIVSRIPPPSGLIDSPLRALVFSSQYDPHKGVVVFVRVVDGSFNGGKLKFMISEAEADSIETGYFMPKMRPSDGLKTGEVGYIATGLKDIKFAKVGDTITIAQNSNVKTQNLKIPQPLPGYKEPKPMVFLGLFPISADDFIGSREAMEKLRLSDSAFTFRPISSAALGNGFHCGFLGLLHAEVVQERILREFNLTMIATSPSVEYRIKLKNSTNPSKVGIKFTEPAYTDVSINDNWYIIQSASEYPDPSFIEETKEPVMNVTIFCPKRYVGAVMQLAQEKRGEYIDLKYELDNAIFTYLIPLSDMIIDFFDRLKSVTEGYASLDYEFFDYQSADIVKVDILLNFEKVDALSFMVVRDQAQKRSREIVEKLAEVIPRQQFNIPVQGALGGAIIARADIKPYRKDVIAKLYGGDRTRKDKLLKKQKKGKAKMKLIGKVEIPQTAFFEVLKR